jgi:uncharacterized protein (TIGR02996 family)
VTDGESLIRSVLANPVDDAPRLVYADWLEEHGRPEDAEFIRVQIELARLGFGGAFHVDSEGRRQQTSDQVALLQERQIDLWMGGFGRPEVPEEMSNWPMSIHPMRSQHLLLRRGFVDRVVSFAGIYMEVAPMLFARQPVTHVRIVGLQLYEFDDGFMWTLESAEGLGGVPEELWPYLSQRDGDEIVYYSTNAEADAALSWACVRYGRAEAGLGEPPA